MDSADPLVTAVRMLEAGLARMERQLATAAGVSRPDDPNLVYLEHQVDGLRGELARLQRELALQRQQGHA